MKKLFSILLILAALSANCSEQKTRKVITIPAAFSNDTLTLLNRMGASVTSGAMPFYIPQTETIDSDRNPIKPEQLFEKYQMHTRTRFGKSSKLPEEFLKHFNIEKVDTPKTATEYWKKLFDTKQVKENEKPPKNAISIKDIPKIVQDAKNLLKFFLATDNELSTLQDQTHFVRKIGLNRLFTYAKLARIINEKKLSHVFLPQKLLAILDTKTNKYVSYKEASDIIDKQLKAYINYRDDIDIDFDDKTEQYRPTIFASKEQKKIGDLNPQALNELKILCVESPFDIGGGNIGQINIFSTPGGDAIIIDTEFKGESKEDCIKIERYR